MNARPRVSCILFVLAAATAVVADPTPDEKLLKTAGVGADGESLLAYLRLRTVSVADRQRIDGLIRQLGDPAFAVRERAMTDLVACGMPAIGPLRQAKDDPDVEIARRAERCLERIERVPSAALSAAVARGISRRKPAGAVEVLLAYLPVADDESVADEVREALAAVAVAGGGPDGRLVRALDDNNPLIRGAAAEALARSDLPAAVRLGHRAVTDGSADVRLRTLLALVTRAKDKSAVPSLIDLLAELPQGAGWRIEDVLIRLAGESAPQVTLGEDATVRRRCRDAWQEWWTKQGAGVDLARLDTAPPMLGRTLVVLREQRSGAGKIVEINAKKEIVWKIDGLQFPSDAVVVGGNHVLIAEENGHQVSERDFTGKVVWSKQIAMPIGVQRLPNGNTFIVSRNELLEIDKRQEKVTSYQRQQQYDICAAQRLRSGETVLLTRTGQCIRLDANHKEVKSFNIPRMVFTIAGLESLPNGRLLVTERERVAEYEVGGGAPAWEAPFRYPTSVQRLPNGNTLVATFQSQTPMVAELDRDKQTVWDYKPGDGSLPWRARRR
jgi:hypothetical protein